MLDFLQRNKGGQYLEAQGGGVEILWEIEMHLSVSIFDLQFHNIMHIVKDVKLAGLVFVRWMYHVKQFLKVLKDYVCQQVQPEGSIAEGYITAEMIFCK